MYNSEHSVGVGADSSRPTIIHNPTNTPQGSSLRKMYINEHSVDVGANLSRPYIIHNPANTPQGLFSA